jgi:hypothetical protein
LLGFFQGFALPIRRKTGYHFACAQLQETMILKLGEKLHVIHRRRLEREPHRHFAGTVEAYENGVARVIGFVYTVDTVKSAFFRRPDRRTRILAISSGDLIVNVIPTEVDIDKIVYKLEKKSVRVTDGSNWYLDISEFAWR